MSAENNAGYSEPRTVVSDDMLSSYATELLAHKSLDGEAIESALTGPYSNEQMYDALFHLAWEADECEMQALDTALNQGIRHPALYNAEAELGDSAPDTAEIRQGLSLFLIIGAHQAVRSLKRFIIEGGNSPYRPRGPRTIWGRRLE